MQDTDKYQLIFTVLQCALFGSPAPRAIEVPTDADWEAVRREMQAQTVHGLIEPILDALPITPAATREAWRMSCIQQQARWHQVAAAQEALLACMAEAGIPCAVIKGLAAAQLYPKPECRSSGDVDFLVAQEDFDRADKLLQAGGYELTKDVDYAAHHIEYRKDGVKLELHRWVGDDEDQSEALHLLLRQGVGQRVTAKAGERVFPALPPMQNGLVLLLHIKHHLRDGLGLRQILDWLLYVDRQLTDACWTAELQPALRELGLHRLACVVTAMGRQYLGLQRTLPGEEPVEPALCGELMEHVMQSGNFGVKTGTDSHDTAAFERVRGPLSLLRRLHEGGMSRWAAARKHKILRPFAWIYQCGHVLKTLLKDKKRLTSLRRLRRQGAQQRLLMERLGLEEKPRA